MTAEFHRDLAIENATSANLRARNNGRIEVSALDDGANDRDTPSETRCVWIKMPSSTTTNFTLYFELPSRATTATYQVGNGDEKPMEDALTARPYFSVINEGHAGSMIDEAVTCRLVWNALEKGAPTGNVTITVRPRAHTSGVA